LAALDIWIDLSLVAIGVLAGTLGSLVGLGGGFIIVPLTTLFLNLPSRIIAGTSTAVIVINSLTSAWVYGKQRRIDYKSAAAFAIASIPGAFVGAHFSHYLPTHLFNLAFGVFLICTSIFLMIKPKEAKNVIFRPTSHRSFHDATGKLFKYDFNLPVGLVAAFFVGFLSSLFGIGGGTVMVPVMVLLLGFPPHVAVATSMMMVLVSSFVGALSHAMLGDVAWLYALNLAIGAWVGGQIGPRMAAKASGPWLLRILGVLMICTALRMIFS
jgi:uncharacterized membrane protein YfcA